MEMTFAQVKEHSYVLENKKNEIITSMIKYNYDNEVLREMVEELKEIDKKLEEINNSLVKVTFLVKK